MAGQLGLVGGLVYDEDVLGGQAGVEPGQEGEVGRLGDEELARRVPDVASQLGAPAGGVDADDDGPGQAGRPQPHGELGNVVEEDADVEGTGPATLDEKGGPVGALLHDLGPGPRPVLEAQARCRVAGPLAQEGGDGGHGPGPDRGAPGRAGHWRRTSSTVTRVASMAMVLAITASAYSWGTPATASVTMATE